MKIAYRYFQGEVFMSKLIDRSIFWMIGLLVLAGSGCAPTIKTFKMNDGLPVSGSTHMSGPAVTLFPVEEALQQEVAVAAAFAADPTYMGEGYRNYGTIWLIVPMWESDEYHADMRRTDIIRTAALSRLKNDGIPVTYQAKGGDDQFMMLPEDRLGITMRIRKFDVDTSFTSLIPFPPIIFRLNFNNEVAHVVLDCKLRQPGTSASLWEGTGEGRFTSGDFKKMKKNVGQQHSNIVSAAVSIAVDQCITKSGLLETRAKLSNQRYARLMTNGRKQATGGNIFTALDTYGQAYNSALTSEQSLDAVKAMAQLNQVMPSNPVLPEDVRRLQINAVGAISDKKFTEAADLYAEALIVAQWWPAGHFNRALVLGETGDYGEAKREMKFYLQLAPDAPNARAAQDKIYDWERLDSK
jgi:hypothetical protein